MDAADLDDSPTIFSRILTMRRSRSPGEVVEEPLGRLVRLKGHLKQHRPERAPAALGPVDCFAPSLKEHTRRGRVTPRVWAIVHLLVGKTSP